MGPHQSYAPLAAVYGRSREAQSNKEKRTNKANNRQWVFLGRWQRAALADCQEGCGRGEDQIGNFKGRQ